MFCGSRFQKVSSRELGGVQSPRWHQRGVCPSSVPAAASRPGAPLPSTSVVLQGVLCPPLHCAVGRMAGSLARQHGPSALMKLLFQLLWPRCQDSILNSVFQRPFKACQQCMGPEWGPHLPGVFPAAAAWPGSWPEAAGPGFWSLWLRGVEGPLLPGEPAGTAQIPDQDSQSLLFLSLTVTDRHFYW